jgi:parvulin-like peptidyl-prolyl isomerase
MKKFIVAVVLLAVLVPAAVLAGCGGTKVPAGAIAAVGSGVVAQQQFDSIWKQAEAQYKNTAGAPAFPKAGTAGYDQLRASIVNYLVQNEVIKQKAASLGVTVSASALGTRVKQITTQVGGQKKLDALLAKNAVTIADLKSQLQAQMLQDAVKAKVASQTKITPAQIKAYYVNPANSHQFQTAASVDARHILVKASDKALALKIEKLLQADNTNAEWAKLAKQYSIDPGTKNSGGNLGNFTRGRMVKPFEDAAFALKVGTVSAPVKTQFGWHIIEVTKKTPASSMSLAQATAQIKATLLATQQTTAWDKWLKTALADAGLKYAAGYDPASLTASPSASPSPSAT